MDSQFEALPSSEAAETAGRAPRDFVGAGAAGGFRGEAVEVSEALCCEFSWALLVNLQ